MRSIDQQWWCQAESAKTYLPRRLAPIRLLITCRRLPIPLPPRVKNVVRFHHNDIPCWQNDLAMFCRQTIATQDPIQTAEMAPMQHYCHMEISALQAPYQQFAEHCWPAEGGQNHACCHRKTGLIGNCDVYPDQSILSFAMRFRHFILSHSIIMLAGEEGEIFYVPNWVSVNHAMLKEMPQSMVREVGPMVQSR